jgi:C_GCAxxG_C_C family probable redox protein
VFSAVAEQIGMDYQTAVRVSAGFGGGMSLGSVCGAVTGGIMAIGLKCGGLGAQAAQTGKLVREFTSRFKAQHRTVNCSELTGMDVTNVELVKKLSADLSKPENLAAAKEALGGRDPKELYAACGAYVRDATKSVSELLNDAPR